MAFDVSDEFRRPVPLALAALAIVGWLLVSYFWSQEADVHAQMDDAMKRAELAREGMAADLQNLQKAAGTEADLERQAKDAQKALADTVATRAAAQNEIADLTKRISEAKLAVSGAQEEANAKTRDLQSIEARLRSETDQLNSVEGQIAESQAQFSDLQRRTEDENRTLADLQARIQAAQQSLDVANKAQEEAKPK
ncbi:MAG: hypothetical protein JO107_06555 [Hyphomicrobiales bacterium]|nr:hypothetical protein [Hyphomicrobiales bacterium]MBV8662746.1 hypothetical protein [Hyphomicrobiales bacterium]